MFKILTVTVPLSLWMNFLAFHHLMARTMANTTIRMMRRRMTAPKTPPVTTPMIDSELFPLGTI